MAQSADKVLDSKLRLGVQQVQQWPGHGCLEKQLKLFLPQFSRYAAGPFYVVPMAGETCQISHMR